MSNVTSIIDNLKNASAKLYKNEDVSLFSEFMNAFYKSLNDAKTTSSKGSEFDTLNLKDYFKELEILQDSLKQVKSVADKIADTNRKTNLELSRNKQELKLAKENLLRKGKKCDKMKKMIEDYRDNTLKLVFTVENELTRIQNMEES